MFNVNTIRKLVESCSCGSSPSSPDDMVLASCLKTLNIDAIHSVLFHQARPNDYAPETLNKNSISFHKFWQIDPLAVYAKWFQQRDAEYYEINKHLLSDYKYLQQNCLTPSTTAKNKLNQNRNVKHMEL